MSTSRLEAFSDGVIAVAITLLVLNLPSVSPATPHLAAYLGRHWPQFAAYAVSFLTIGIVWINHHSMVSRLASGDHVILVVNLLLLMTIVLLPFTTDLMATYLRHARPADERLAAAVYSGSFLLMAVTFSALNWQILIRRHDLLAPPMTDAERRGVFRRAVSGLVPYVVATAIAPFSPLATLAICGVVAGFYALPLASGR
jgi:uncharacterized membrane protein